SFPGMSPAASAGLDAGIETGPAGTLFLTYFGVDSLAEDVTVLAERPGGVSGAETQFDTGMLSGITSSPSGLTFSPFINDPGTTAGGIYHSGGFAGRTPTTTTSPPTTTTLPPAGCESGPSFPSIECRLGGLIAQVDAAPDVIGLAAKLDAKLARARQLTTQAA